MIRSTSAAPRPALVAACLGFFVIQLDATVVNVALDAIRADLGGTLADQQWVVASYTVALAAGMLTAGSMGDRFGSRRVCLWGLAAFALASVACAAAPDVPVLIAARTVQGIGAAALLPCSLALIVHQFPDPGERAHALGVWGGVSGIGMAAGPVLGGVLVAASGWPAIFLVNVPVCMAAFVMIRRHAAESPARQAGPLDLPGLVLGTAGLAGLAGGLIEAGHRGWTHPLPLALVLAGATLLPLFVLVERRAREPMLPMSVFTSLRFSAGTGVGFLFNFCLYGSLLCLSLYLQGPLGQSAFAAGMQIFPLTVAICIGAAMSGRLTGRFGARAPMLAGLGAGAAGASLLLAAGSSGPLPLVVTGATVLGFCSFAMPAMTSVVMSGVGADRAGLGSGVLNTARQAGGALGAAVLGSLLVVGSGMSLVVPMAVTVAAYTAAIGLTLLATRR
ncbi:DHA2 family methylenomycin A resistance protein-like MFS transporter [Pseudonocardia hierapolitana]|uniref:DHA2 family methylenomycin A resistance protein-like MFS transporter n=1 Tax=Pseudonocardia hierapolitana TaxID=1128676 RepID=A0A561SUT3_9PSEU|nr:MFS transporter [Pseudonocardia hierapolitana]TWF78612.1 DHA2 family methylenomycin A resistance protein-like MFS transporter [Pseudonocardia hierapolitana]